MNRAIRAFFVRPEPDRAFCARDSARLALCLVTALVGMALCSGPSWGFQNPPPKRGSGPREKPRPQKPPTPPSKEKAKKEKEPEKDDSKEDSKDEAKKLGDLKSAQKLPRLLEMEVPTVAQLHQRPVDWLVIVSSNKTNPEVLEVKPVFPRPDTLKKLAATLEELRKRPRPATPEEREKLDAQKADLQKLMVQLPDDETRQMYEIPTAKVDRIVYHEDLTIRRAALLADQKRFRDALELLYPLERTVPKWQGLEDEARRMLLSEARADRDAADYQGALMSLTELHARDRNYPGLQDCLGDVTEKSIEAARKDNDDRRARYFLRRLARLESEHPTVEKWERSLQSEAQGLMDSALAAERDGRHADAVTTIDRAARVWPRITGMADAHRTICDRYQRLSVGTMTLPGDNPGLPSPTLADQRETRLAQFDLFEVDRVDDATHYRSRLLEQWEPTDLGRRAHFTLRRAHARWESRPDLTAVPVMSTIRALIDPASPAFDERFASYVDGVQLRSPLELEVKFSRAPPRLEPLFRFPISAAGSAEPNAGGAGSERPGLGPVLSRRFESQHTDGRVNFRRVYPQPNGLDQYHLAEIDERRFDSPPHEVQALLRGEVSMLLDLPPWAVDPLRRDTRFFVLDYAIPTTHVLQFNPASQPLKSRELRLALSYAIDAQRILSERILRSPDSTAGRLTTAPFATTSYAYNALLPRRESSVAMAYGLNVAAVKRLKTIPPLRLVCERDPEALSCATDIIAQWKRVGIAAELVLPPPPTGGAHVPHETLDWDIAYRKMRMEEPLVDLWPFLTVNGGARLESVRAMPDWLRAELLDLDNAPDWKTAINRLQSLHAHLYAEVACIPLWEVDDVIVLRKNVRDFPAYKFVNAYQDVERWIVQSWYTEDEQ